MNAIRCVFHIILPMQNNTATNSIAAHLLLRKEKAVRLIIIRNKDALGIPPVKVLIQKLSKLSADSFIFSNFLQIAPALKFNSRPAVFRNR